MEIRILDWLQGLHTPILDQMMCAVTSLGNAGIIWIVVAVVLLIVPKTRRVGMAVTAASFATTAALFFAGKKKKLWIPALVLSVLITFSRLYLYVHYPTDVLGGMLVGILCGWIGARQLLFLSASLYAQEWLIGPEDRAPDSLSFPEWTCHIFSGR